MPLGGSLDFQEFPQTFIRAILGPKPGFFKNRHFPHRKIKLFEREGGNPDFQNFLGWPPYTVFYDGLWHFARVRLRNRFILLMSILLLAYYLTLFFQIVVFQSSGASRCRFRPPKRTLPPSKTFILRRQNIYF